MQYHDIIPLVYHGIQNDIIAISEMTYDFTGPGYKDPDGEIENSRKSIFEIRIPNFCYIQVIVLDLSYLPVAAVET